MHSASCGAPVEAKRYGLASRLLAKCTACHKEFPFNTCKEVELSHLDGKKKMTWEYNAAAVMGEMSTGGGHASLEELLVTLGVPSMTKKLLLTSKGVWGFF